MVGNATTLAFHSISKGDLSFYQWCEQNGIHPGTFYNWVSKLKKSGYKLPNIQKNSEKKPEIQEVVKVDLIDSVSE